MLCVTCLFKCVCMIGLYCCILYVHVVATKLMLYMCRSATQHPEGAQAVCTGSGLGSSWKVCSYVEL